MPTSPADRMVTFCTGLIVGLAVGIPGGAWLVSQSVEDPQADPGPGTAITEDDPRWDCATMGDLVCGPSNATGSYPGRYEHGNLVEPWPVDQAGRWLGHGQFVWTGVAAIH